MNLAKKVLNLSVRARLVTLLGVSLLALIVVGIGGWFGISRVYSTTVLLSENKLPASILLGNIRGDAGAYGRAGERRRRARIFRHRRSR